MREIRKSGEEIGVGVSIIQKRVVLVQLILLVLLW